VSAGGAKRGLVLSIFPGIDVLGMGFEEEGFCIVRGPDVLWGGDIHDFHPPAGVFDGVIGGPPCQAFSRVRHLNPHTGKHGNLIPEFERCVREACPDWFLMENVSDAPAPVVDGYGVVSRLLNNRWLGAEQDRLRRFSFGRHEAAPCFSVQEVALESPLYTQAVTCDPRAVPVAIGGSGKPKTVTAEHGTPFDRPRRSIEELCELQGLPRDFCSEMPFTAHGKRKAIGNAVPLPMARAVAKAVVKALERRAP